jgi:hypothetical protein
MKSAGQEAPRGTAQVVLVEDHLLTGDPSPAALAHLWQGPLGGLLLTRCALLSWAEWGVLGQCWGVQKPTVMRWLAPVAQVHWRAVVQQGRRSCSGLVARDEQWVQMAEVWWSLGAAVDHVSGMSLHVALLPSNSGVYGQRCRLQGQPVGYRPTVIVTAG